jgi:hypothetical protein
MLLNEIFLSSQCISIKIKRNPSVLVQAKAVGMRIRTASTDCKPVRPHCCSSLGCRTRFELHVVMFGCTRTVTSFDRFTYVYKMTVIVRLNLTFD